MVLLREREVFASSLINKTAGAAFVVVGREWGSFNPYHTDFVEDKVVAVLRHIGLTMEFHQPLHGWLTHGDRIALCNRKTSPEELTATDALVTQEVGLPLFAYVADCAPVVIFDPVQPALALIHCGRKGARKNICGQVVQYLREQLGSRSKNLLVSVGPYIGACTGLCYSVGLQTGESFI